LWSAFTVTWLLEVRNYFRDDALGRVPTLFEGELLVDELVGGSNPGSAGVRRIQDSRFF